MSKLGVFFLILIFWILMGRACQDAQVADATQSQEQWVVVEY